MAIFWNTNSGSGIPVRNQTRVYMQFFTPNDACHQLLYLGPFLLNRSVYTTLFWEKTIRYNEALYE